MNYKLRIFVLIFVGIITLTQIKASNNNTNDKFVSKAWVADNGDGTYTNPIIHADYSDPDVCRVGDDYYMTSSSFNCVPGLPVLHSKDLVNWELISYALPKVVPADVFDVPQHGNGVWAPSIRFHEGELYIFWGDPDFGIYYVKAKDPKGPWTKPYLIKAGKGLIDPCPLWDEDGKAYLSFAFAGSRAGVKSVLIVSEMEPDCSALTGDAVMVFDGHKDNPTVEGTKFYKRNGYYYIFAPAGGVKPGWQLALRAETPFGPYEAKRVLEQGSTDINGPHQGAWVETVKGEHWFIHFQDRYAYGRVVHMNPMKWENDWPVMGVDYDGNGVGEPVTTYKKPDVDAEWPLVTPVDTDEFNSHQLGIQWQWHANPKMKFGFPSGNLGFYRLNCRPRPENYVNLWAVPNLFLQKFPAQEFTATAKATVKLRADGEEAGFIVMGEDYQYVALKQVDGNTVLRVVKCEDARKEGAEKEIFSQPYTAQTIYFKVEVNKDALCKFSISENGKQFTQVGDKFEARAGRWIGAKLGFFALRNGLESDTGDMDIDWIRIDK